MTFRKMSAFKEAKYSHLNERHVSSECEMFPLIHDTNLQFINKLSLCPTCRTTPAPWLPRLGGGEAGDLLLLAPGHRGG